MTVRTLRRSLGALLGVLALILLGRALAPAAVIYQDTLGPRTILAIGTFGKLLFLVVATVATGLNRGSFEPGTPTRTAWQWLFPGFGALMAGQAIIAFYQFGLGLDEAPFPSIADVFFVLSYPLMIAALVLFLRAYLQSGFPVGSRPERIGMAVGILLLCAAIGYPILKPLVSSEAVFLERLLNLLYPVMDGLLLIPTALLIRISVRFRGGAVWKIWATLLAGCVFLCIADVLFAWFSQLGRTDLVDLVDLTYLLSYGLFAQGVLYQRQLLVE